MILEIKIITHPVYERSYIVKRFIHNFTSWTFLRVWPKDRTIVYNIINVLEILISNVEYFVYKEGGVH